MRKLKKVEFCGWLSSCPPDFVVGRIRDDQTSPIANWLASSRGGLFYAYSDGKVQQSVNGMWVLFAHEKWVERFAGMTDTYYSGERNKWFHAEDTKTDITAAQALAIMERI